MFCFQIYFIKDLVKVMSFLYVLKIVDILFTPTKYYRTILNRFKNNKVFITAFLTACYTGMRTGEVFALTWNDIDLDNRIIKISKTVYAKDKEEKGRWYLGTTKTIGSKREVYICDILYKILLDYKKIKDNYKKQYGKNYKRYILEEVEKNILS